jgi:mono/diheme cytochrome c family protein
MNMKHSSWRTRAAGFVAGVAALGMAGQTMAASVDPVPQLLKSPADVTRGKNLFMGTCGAYCHKLTSANGDAPFLFDCDWIFGGSDEQIFHTITHGVPNSRMVAFGGAIPDQDIWRIIAYLRSASQCKK